MPLTLINYPRFTQWQSANKNYQIGSFNAASNQWFRISLDFNAAPVHNGIGLYDGNYYNVSVIGPDSSSTTVASGILFGDNNWLPGGLHGVYLAPTDGACQLWFSTQPENGNDYELSGACDYDNFVAIAETYPAADGADPVIAFSLPQFQVADQVVTIGSFTAVPNQSYKIICAFDGITLQQPDGFSYLLTGQNLAGLPTGPQTFFNTGSVMAAKSFITAVVTAQAADCTLQLQTVSLGENPAIRNLVAFVEPFGPAVNG